MLDRKSRSFVGHFLDEGKIDLKWRDKSGLAAIHYAAGGGDHLLEITKLLVEAGADVNLEEDDGYTPLHWSSVMECHNISTYLISQGADLCKRPIEENTPLVMTSHDNGGEDVHFTMMNSLGWDVGVPGTVNGWTKLHRAVLDQLFSDLSLRQNVYLGETKAIQKLIEESGGNVDMPDIFGLTALHHAVRGKLLHEDEKWMDFTKDHIWHKLDITSNLVPSKANVRLVKCLLNLGASVSRVDNHGHGAMWHAHFFNQNEIIPLLNGHVEKELGTEKDEFVFDEQEVPKDHPFFAFPT